MFGPEAPEQQSTQGQVMVELDALASIVVELVPRAACLFRSTPSRALHAALLDAIRSGDPDRSRELHDAPAGAHTIEREWTVSGLDGPFQERADGGGALPGRRYRARLTA